MMGARAILLLLGVAAAMSANAQDSNGGRVLYEANGCFQCHGYAGQGGAGPRIAPSAYPLEAFVALVRRPSNEMPAYAPQALSDAELGAIYRYVRSIHEPPAVAAIPLLR